MPQNICLGFFSFLLSGVDFKCAMGFKNPMEHQKLPAKHLIFSSCVWGLLCCGCWAFC